jgi:cytochrome c-type biogenesis protein CcmE
MLLRFGVEDAGEEKGVVASVVFENLKPDMFAAGRDVLIDGDYVGGVIRAAKLQTQCPSKYEPALPGAHPGGMSGASGAAMQAGS